MNDYYNTPAVPVDYTLARAEQIKQQFAAIAGGFDKLPLPKDLHENRIGFVVAGGTANALTADFAVAPLSYQNGMTLKLGITATNSGPATINVNALGVVPIVGRLINPLTGGDLVIGTVETMIYYAGKFIIREVSGAQGPQGNVGPPGPLDGSTIVSGAAAPTTEGNNGDFYIRTGVWTIYGPKTAGAWGAPTNIIGPAGINGTNGTNGTNGINGLNVRHGAVNPVAGDGVDGEFWINTATNFLFGPKVAGAWPAGVSLVGPQGIQGVPGTGGSWNTLSDRPENLTDIAVLAGVDGGLIKFTGPNTMVIQTLVSMIDGLSATDKGLIAGDLGAIRIESMSLANPGYIRFQLPDGSFAIFQWGTASFAANGSTTVNYPCPTAYSSFSVAVVSSARSITNAQDNCAQTVSCGTTSFLAYSANDVVLPGFWLAWGI